MLRLRLPLGTIPHHEEHLYGPAPQKAHAAVVGVVVDALCELDGCTSDVCRVHGPHLFAVIIMEKEVAPPLGRPAAAAGCLCGRGLALSATSTSSGRVLVTCCCTRRH